MTSAHPEALRALFARLVDGDRTAFDPAFSALWPRVRAFCGAALRHDADADDAAQETLMRLFAQAHSWDQQTSPLGWAIEIARWQCRTTLTQRRRRPAAELDEAHVLADAGPLPDQAAIDAQLHSALAAALEGLTPADRAALETWSQPPPHDARQAAAQRQRRHRATGRLIALWRFIYGP